MLLTHVRLGIALLTAGMLFLAIQPLPAADWPQYRGPDTAGISLEELHDRWPAAGPPVLWKVPTRNGFSSFAVSGDKVFTQVNREVDGRPRELLVALDAATGRELWSQDVGVGTYQQGGDAGAPDNRGGDGPRSTPAVSEGRVYVLNQDIVLFCVEAATGQLLWQRDVLREHGGRNIPWKSGASPVVEGKLVFVAGGGRGAAFLAFDKATGQLAWKTGNDAPTQATPALATLHGVRQIIFFAQSGLVSLAVADGRELWRFPFPFRTATAASPVVEGTTVFCTAGYEIGGAACRIVKRDGGLAAEQLWRSSGNKDVASLWGTPVPHRGHLYGMISFKQFGRGPLKCVDLATGRVRWQQPGFGAGQVILARDKLVALADDGRLVILQATPEGYRELATSKVLQGKCWSSPALAHGRLYVRSTAEGACLDVAAR